MSAELPGVAAVLERGLAQGAAPGLSAAVLFRGAPVHASCHGDAQREPERRPLGSADLFDLASLTKVFVATAAARLVDRDALALDAPVAGWLGWSGAKGRVTVRQLLAHASGLPAYRPFFEAAAGDPVARPAFAPRSLRPAADALIPAFRRGAELVEAGIAAEELESAPGSSARYSDLGFMALGLLLERAGGADLDALVASEVLEPLGLSRTFFLPGLQPARSAARRAAATFAATRRDPARGGEVLCGAVDDDNAWAMGGVAGHAGLFGPAEQVAALGQAWLGALAGRSPFLSRAVAAEFVARDPTPGSERALGWDTPSPSGSALGTRLGRGPRGAVGHLGFTGTSLWMDLDREVVCALLTNHVHPDGPDRPRLRAIRAAFHDAVAEALGI